MIGDLSVLAIASLERLCCGMHKVKYRLLDVVPYHCASFASAFVIYVADSHALARVHHWRVATLLWTCRFWMDLSPVSGDAPMRLAHQSGLSLGPFYTSMIQLCDSNQASPI